MYKFNHALRAFTATFEFQFYIFDPRWSNGQITGKKLWEVTDLWESRVSPPRKGALTGSEWLGPEVLVVGNSIGATLVTLRWWELVQMAASVGSSWMNFGWREKEHKKILVATWHTLRGEEGRERRELIEGFKVGLARFKWSFYFYFDPNFSSISKPVSFQNIIFVPKLSRFSNLPQY